MKLLDQFHLHLDVARLAWICDNLAFCNIRLREDSRVVRVNEIFRLLLRLEKLDPAHEFLVDIWTIVVVLVE